MNFGLIPDEAIETYHASDAFSYSKLKVFRRLPLLYKLTYIDKVLPARPETKATRIGSAVDVLLLEGVSAYEERVRVTPEVYGPDKKPWNWNANECKAWREARPGKVILTGDEASQVEEISQAVFRHPTAAALLEKGKPAMTFRFDYGFAAGQCRTDWLGLDGCKLPSGEEIGPYWVELKTAASLISSDFYTFEDAYLSQGYWLQTALYREITRDVLGPKVPPLRPLFIVADKLDFPLCQVFDPLATERGREHFELAQKIVERDLERLATCYTSGIWPGLPTGIQPLELPRWKAKELEKEVA